MSTALDDARILIIGASAGIGRALATEVIAAGATTAVVARRTDALAEVCGDAPNAHAITADIGDSAACAALVTEAATALGGFDAIIHCAGVGTMSRIEQADAAAWERDHRINMIAPTLITAAALPHLAPTGVVAFLSSESATEPRWGMSTYATSKAALDCSIDYWNLEHPERRFVRIIMGATMPTDFGGNFEIDILTEALGRWGAAGVSGSMMETSEVGSHLAASLAVMLAHPGVNIPVMRYQAPDAPFAD